IRDFCELGLGIVDLKGAIGVLKETGYDGWLTIELDYTRRTPFESVEMSKDYLLRELHLEL
ncbi:MAG TPA: xylose isomerase, partial [Chloroflexota bacterium]|nr:xylose isomerase [Chloroflexota bacterium]